jgi:hypothetical protein
MRPISARSLGGGVARYSRPRTSILHNEDGDCKRFLRDWPPHFGSPPDAGFRALSGKTDSNE